MKDRELSERILAVTRTHPEHTYNYKQIAAVLAVKDPFVRKRIVTLLAQLAKNGILEEHSRGKYQIKTANLEHE
jgi:ribonuclease R